STIKYLSAAVVYRVDGKLIVHLVADAQNGFGAMIRQGHCVSMKRLPGKITWGRLAVVPCGVQRPSPAMLDSVVDLNGWNSETLEDDAPAPKRVPAPPAPPAPAAAPPGATTESASPAGPNDEDLSDIPTLLIHCVRVGLTQAQVRAGRGYPP